MVGHFERRGEHLSCEVMYIPGERVILYRCSDEQEQGLVIPIARERSLLALWLGDPGQDCLGIWQQLFVGGRGLCLVTLFEG